MDNDSNKITWVVVIVACVALIGFFAVNTLFPTQIKNVETYISNVLDNTENSDTLSDINSSSKKGFLYSINTDNTMSIIGYTGSDTKLNIPASVKYNGVLYNITAIGTNAFKNTNLTSVTISDSIKTIGSDAFSHNPLTSIVLGNSVKTIGIDAFYDCYLTSITIPNSVTLIDKWAFCHNNIVSLIFSTSLTNINTGAFAVNSLTSVTLPDSLTSIGTDAFQHNHIASITAPAELQSQIESNDVFSDNASTLSITYK